MIREEFLAAIHKGLWQQLIVIFKDNVAFDNLMADDMVADIFQNHFMDSLLSQDLSKNEGIFIYHLHEIYKVYKRTKYSFDLSDEDASRLIVKIVEGYRLSDNLGNAYKIALDLPDNETCKEAIELFRKEQAKYVRHSREGDLIVKTNEVRHELDYTRSLFRSQLEEDFYSAALKVFPSYVVLPNVALHAVVDYNSIKESLSSDERSFLLKCLIDCVVVDPTNEYKPFKFIELDSVFHDNEPSKKKDAMKDRIIGIAGHHLYRVRPKNKKPNQTDLMNVITEVIRN